jgi:hypothetical protein
MVRPLFFSPSEWEVAGLVSIYSTARPKHLFHSALSANGDHVYERWIGKNAEESGFAYVIANEFICAQLAAEVGLRLPDCKIENIGQRAWFVSYYTDNEQFTYSKFRQCRNIGDVPLLLLFDLWVCNPDRSLSNVLLSRVGDTPATYELLLIDHSHALFADVHGPRAVPAEVEPQRCFDFRELAEQIRGDADWDFALSRLHGLSQEAVWQIIEGVPDGICPAFNKLLTTNWLIRRRKQLDGLLRQAKASGCFPNWV